jgi:cation/acetate symporter
VAIWVISLIDFGKRPAIDRAGYDEQRVRAETGIGAAGASAH